MHTFDFDRETVPVKEFVFASRQQYLKTQAVKGERIWVYRYALKAEQIPKYIRDEMSRRGYEPVRVGSTTYRSSTWALVKKKV
ncbi:MAG: hypothetical protein WCS21_07840 [Lachnospiraceae bacterium]